MPDDPRDALNQGISALSALSDVLLHAAGPERRDLHLVDPEQLYCLLDCVRARFQIASDLLSEWRPA
jgi:hypothetical protein